MTTLLAKSWKISKETLGALQIFNDNSGSYDISCQKRRNNKVKVDKCMGKLYMYMYKRGFTIANIKMVLVDKSDLKRLF